MDPKLADNPPSYAEHRYDALYVENLRLPVEPLINYQPPAETTAAASLSNQEPSQAPPLSTLIPAESSTLTIDNNAIYPPPPSSAIYHLPRHLNWNGNEISLQSGSAPITLRSGGQTYNKDLGLYVIRRTPFKSEISLIPQRRSCFGRGKTAVMDKSHGYLGRVWEVQVNGTTVLSCERNKWKDYRTPQHRLVATEKATMVDRKSSAVKDQLELAENIDEPFRDLIVAAWAARLWQANRKVPFVDKFKDFGDHGLTYTGKGR